MKHFSPFERAKLGARAKMCLLRSPQFSHRQKEKSTETLATQASDGWREHHKTKGLISKTITLHVRYPFWYISLPSSAKQQREMTKFTVLCRTWAHDSEFSFFYLNCNVFLTESAPGLFGYIRDRLNKLKLSPRSLKYLVVIFKVTFSFALPSCLLKLPIIKC